MKPIDMLKMNQNLASHFSLTNKMLACQMTIIVCNTPLIFSLINLLRFYWWDKKMNHKFLMFNLLTGGARPRQNYN